MKIESPLFPPSVFPDDQDWTSRGFVAFGRVGGDGAAVLPPGALADLEPRSGDGPFLVVPAEEAVVSGPATEPMFWGFYRNVVPGEYELVWNEASGDCRWVPALNAGWPPKSARENAARVVVRAGYVTYFTALYCPLDVLDADGGVLDAAADAAM